VPAQARFHCLNWKFGGHAVAGGWSVSTTWLASTFVFRFPALTSCRAPRAPESNIQFSGVGGLPTYISFTQGADDMSDRDEWISYSHWGMFLTGRKHSK
jgi:hypothetical protein